jgi:hypothetical protein
LHAAGLQANGERQPTESGADYRGLKGGWVHD